MKPNHPGRPRLDSNEQILPQVEGRDYYFEGGLMVITGEFLKRRGYCCESGCRHCPYGFTKSDEELDSDS